MDKITLRDLVVDHDYYCHDNNYYSNDAALSYDTFSDFYDEFKYADVDLNLVFRWDLRANDEGGHNLEIFIIKQRKGIFTPVSISVFEEKDVPLFLDYIRPHIEKLKNIWEPFKF